MRYLYSYNRKEKTKVAYKIKATVREFENVIYREYLVSENMQLNTFIFSVMKTLRMNGAHLWMFGKIGDVKKLKGNWRGSVADVEKMSEEEIENYRPYHYFEKIFYIDKEYYQDDVEEYGDILYNASRFDFKELNWPIGSKMELHYDFKNDWYIDFEIVDIIKNDEYIIDDIKFIDYKGYGIIEDIPGNWGLEKYWKAMQKGKGKDFLRYAMLTHGPIDIEDAKFKMIYDEDEVIFWSHDVGFASEMYMGGHSQNWDLLDYVDDGDDYEY